MKEPEKLIKGEWHQNEKIPYPKWRVKLQLLFFDKPRDVYYSPMPKQIQSFYITVENKQLAENLFNLVKNEFEKLSG